MRRLFLSALLAFLVCTTALSGGIQSLRFYSQDTDNFGTNSNMALICEYWIDDDFANVSKVTISDNEATFFIDALSLSVGLHTLSYRVKDIFGRYSPTSTWMFFRTELSDTTIDNKVEACEYWFDGDANNVKNIEMTDHEASFSADASNLSDGVHTISYRIRDALGNYSTSKCWLFIKNAQLKGRRIAWYKTWWNYHYELADKVNVETDSTVFVLAKQIEVPEYAKKDGFSRNSTARFNIVFGDDAGNTSRIESFVISYPDNIPPVSTIEIVKQTNEQVSLEWYADEDDIDFYNVYISEDNKPFFLWLPNTTATNATFKMKEGVSYRFMVTARDKSGNIEKYDETKCVTINQ